MGDADQGWLIMRNARTTLGLFRAMLESTTLTCDPGWDAEANELSSFADVREIQRDLKAAGVQLDSEVDESGQGREASCSTTPTAPRSLSTSTCSARVGWTSRSCRASPNRRVDLMPALRRRWPSSWCAPGHGGSRSRGVAGPSDKRMRSVHAPLRCREER